MISPAIASTDDYIDISDMASYDHSVQKNIAKLKMSEFGMMVPPSREVRALSTPDSETGTCDSSCVRSLEYLQRIVKSLLRQMNVHSHIFGPKEAITIDLIAELKYDDYQTLYQFMNSKTDSDKYLYRIDEIISNFIHVADHCSSRFDFLESIFHISAFYSLKFWIILLMVSVVGTMIFILFAKLVKTTSVSHQLLYGFLIVFIVSCVWSYSSSFEDKQAEIHAHMVQSSGQPPPDCDYSSMNTWNSIKYFFRVKFLGYKDQCEQHYANTMTDPLWKVNPVESISNTAAILIFGPLEYIGSKLGGFYVNFIDKAPFLLKPVLLVVAVFLTVLLLYGPMRISTPIFTIEPAGPRFFQLQAPPHHPVHPAIGQERNELMERPDGPVVRSVRDAGTDMDGFQEYLFDEGTDELEIIGPFARFNLEGRKGHGGGGGGTSSKSGSLPLIAKPVKFNQSSKDKGSSYVIKVEKPDNLVDDKCSIRKTEGCGGAPSTSLATHLSRRRYSSPLPGVIIKKEPDTDVVECIALPDQRIKLIREGLLRDECRDPDVKIEKKVTPKSEDILP